MLARVRFGCLCSCMHFPPIISDKSERMEAKTCRNVQAAPQPASPAFLWTSSVAVARDLVAPAVCSDSAGHLIPEQLEDVPGPQKHVA